MAISASEVIFWHDYTDGSGATVSDETSNGYDITLTGSPTWGTAGIPANLSGYIALNGSSQYGQIGHDTPLDFGTSDRTIGAWVYTTDITDRQCIFFKGDTSGDWYALTFEGNVASNNVGFLIDDGADLDFARGGAANISNSTWHLIVGTWDATSEDMILYIDNQQRASDLGVVMGDVSSAQNLEVGWGGNELQGAGAGGDYLIGRLAQTFMIDRVIDSTERAAIWNSGDGALYADVVGGGGGYTFVPQMKPFAGL